MVADAEGIPSFGDTHTNEQDGQAYSGFLLNFRDTMLVISGDGCFSTPPLDIRVSPGAS